MAVIPQEPLEPCPHLLIFPVGLCKARKGLLREVPPGAPRKCGLERKDAASGAHSGEPDLRASYKGRLAAAKERGKQHG